MLGLTGDRLSIYLNDHLAGATAGVELARRTAHANRGTGYERVLQPLAGEIEEDRATLREVMARLSVRADPLKVVAGWSAEKAGRLKFNGTLIGYSPLSRVEELEGLLVGVNGKLALWTALESTHGADPRLAGVDLEGLIGRARAQRRRLQGLHGRAVQEALA